MSGAAQPNSGAARRSLPSWITLIALYALAGLQVALVLYFWSSFETLVDWVRWVLCGVGGGLAVVEIFALVVASEAAGRGELSKAFAYRTVFVALALLNVAAEIGAVATLTAGDQAQRAGAAQAYAEAVATKSAADSEIVRLRNILDADRLNRPSAALRAEMEAAQRIRDGYTTQGRTAPWRVLENAARLESAYATALEVDRQLAVRATAQAGIDRAGGAAPHTVHPQFETLAMVARSAGIATNADQVRAWLAFGLAAVMKLVLAVGFWTVTPTRRRERAPAGDSQLACGEPHLAPLPVLLAPPTEAAPRNGVVTMPQPAARPRKARRTRPVETSGLHDVLDDIDGTGRPAA
jgi:hypothetical protein